jgi:hypothetical protein
MDRENFSTLNLLVVAAAAWTVTACATTPHVPGSGTWQADDSGAFITTLGDDTLAVERFVIRGNTLDAQAVVRTPRTTLYDVHMEWADDGRLSVYQLRQRLPGAPSDSLIGSVSAVTRGDSVVWTRLVRGETRTATTVGGDARAVFIPPLYSPYAVLARIALARGDNSALVLNQGGNFVMQVSRPGAAWLALDEPQLRTIRLRLDPTWRLQEVDATGGTLGNRVQRVVTADIDSWARTFAAREVAGQGLGRLSLPDSVRATIGSANVAIAYHRPIRRGRVIFGGVVPYGRVWRTGANQATAFTTDRDLIIGGTRVPAGSYTIWTIPNEQGWQLILNKQTGQWGTVYNQKEDLGRVDANVSILTTPVETLTLNIVDTPAGATFVMTFANIRAEVPFVVH